MRQVRAALVVLLVLAERHHRVALVALELLCRELRAHRLTRAVLERALLALRASNVRAIVASKVKKASD